MSNYHIKTVRASRTKIEVVFHFAVPNDTTFAGINLRTALTQYRPNPGSAVPWQQSGTEFDAIQNGEVYEEVEVRTVAVALTKAQVRDEIDARWTQLNAKVPDKIAALLDFWGYDRDVP